jgi:O-antigen ligase
MVEKEAIMAVASLNFDEVPYSSFGIRLHSWVAATDFIKKKPLLGWGSNGRGLVMEYTTWLPDSIGDFGHLHNSYMEILVNYGIVGLIFYFSIWIVIGKMLFKQIREGNTKKAVGYLFATIMCFWGVMNCFESFQNFWTGIFYFNIFMAGILSKIWRASYPLNIKVLSKNHLQPN